MRTVLAGCVITDDYGRILLLHRNTEQFQHWELPGGKVEEDESPEEAAVRELREELGVLVELVGTIGNQEIEDDNGEFLFYWFQVVITKGTPKVHEINKFDDTDYFDFEDLMSLSLSASAYALYAGLVSGELRLQP